VALSAAIGHCDPRVAAHSHRVAEMAVNLGRGLMDVESLYVLEIACLLHDVGIMGSNQRNRHWVIPGAGATTS